jgi:hypothetical protein
VEHKRLTEEVRESLAEQARQTQKTELQAEKVRRKQSESKRVTAQAAQGAEQLRHEQEVSERTEQIRLDLDEAKGAERPAPSLTQWQRVTSIFSAPSKTFEDIKRGNKSWWLPYLLVAIVGYILIAAITTKVGWQQVEENNIRMIPKYGALLNQMPPDRRAATIKINTTLIESIKVATPVIWLILAAVASLILWLTINFLGLRGSATYGQILAVFFYARLPALLQLLIGTVPLLAGSTPESFNINNYSGTNVAYYWSPEDTNMALYAVASQFDIIDVWVAVLLSIGIAKVAGKKRTAGYVVVFGWWGVWTLIRVMGEF